jgi:NAD(P)-dependent dehydrogenase (short-subunit alcohol dehydrogenase family)
MPTVLITGGHSGLGLEAAKQLAAGPKLNLVLAGRSIDKMEAAAKQIRSRYGVKVATLKLDLSSLASTREAAKDCRTMLKDGQIDSLQAVICNAGAMFPGPIAYSVDGFEETFAGNYLGHFLLVNLLLDVVSAGGRIVFTASGTHDPETMDGKMAGGAVEPDAQALALDGKNGVKPISGGKRYATSKLCVILFAYELNRRLRHSQSSLASIAFDPGQIPETGLGRTYPTLVRWLSRTSVVKGILKMLGVTVGSVSFSGAGLAKMVMDPAFAGGSGKYFQSNNGTLREARSSKVSYDKDRAKKLWSDSAQLVHLQESEKPTLLQ